ncbi:LacI family DNA-binding transcriptional regulator [Bifidobacterium sp.]|jgi:DNA-binding LacI/PurR family transcriptional regulator|uniref:LacI family DNA-binding transcriptional regulator n=1 Tax=Bifidobacterium sp. TaxID=41200 RepID=UPI0025BF853B|nr:LacI family DNA-binding transcriptional regulator [Bifidobacterium sp.]MCH4160945.1 LacI family transcriptional regulator [Bifidobacterium sp.]MCH4175642.1 LacI family transcriptional regulator [Bifidobacterium sp.]MCI1635110.1 LacI family transcriptional regulator [Bifidobacterium sp.]
MRASISDVAKKSGVSVATVSRSFTRPELVSQITRAKVLKAAESLNFAVSRAPGTLKSGQSLRIALLIGSADIEWFTAGIMSGLNAVLRKEGYDLVLYPIDSLETRKDFFTDLPLRRNADAVIVSSFDILPEEVARLKTMNIPIVGINVSSPSGFSASVSIDDNTGIGLAVRHLYTLGHTNIMYILESFGSSLSFSSQHRVTGFIKACQDLGIQHRVLQVDDGDTCINVAMTALLEQQRKPTALCFHQDSLAVPFLYQMRKYGMGVPSDISITGFDDSTFAEEVGLTTVRQDPKALGTITAGKTLALIRGEHIDKAHETIPVELMLRHTTAQA